MTRRREKDAMFDGISVVAKALGSGRRAEIIELLAQGERPVEQIAHEIDQSVANTSHHLQVLARSGLVTSRRDGVRVIYSLASGRVLDLWEAVRDLAVSSVPEAREGVDAYVGDRRDLDTITAEELQRLMRDDAVVLVDVRPRAEFDAGHVPGALSIPVDELGEGLAQRLAGKLDGREIVAYCRGPYCVFSDDAVRLLRRGGYTARRLTVGYPEWLRYTATATIEGTESDVDGRTVAVPASQGGTRQ